MRSRRAAVGAYLALNWRGVRNFPYCRLLGVDTARASFAAAASCRNWRATWNEIRSDAAGMPTGRVLAAQAGALPGTMAGLAPAVAGEAKATLPRKGSASAVTPSVATARVTGDRMRFIPSDEDR